MDKTRPDVADESLVEGGTPPGGNGRTPGQGPPIAGVTALRPWIEGTLALGGLAAVVSYGVVRTAYALFYEPFGLEPEDLGITQTRALATALPLAVFGMLFIMFMLAFSVLGYVLARTAREIGAEPGSPRQFFRTLRWTDAVGIVIGAVGLVGLGVTTGNTWTAVALGLVFWSFALLSGVNTAQAVSAIILAVSVSLAYAYLAGDGGWSGMVLVFALAVAVVIAWRGEELRLARWVPCLILVIVAFTVRAWAPTSSEGVSVFIKFVLLAGTFAAMGIAAGMGAPSAGDVGALLRRMFPGGRPPLVAPLAVVLLSLALPGAWVWDYWVDAEQSGNELAETMRRKPLDELPVHFSPARLTPVTSERALAETVCSDGARAAVLGRPGDRLVLLIGRPTGSTLETHALIVNQDDFVVETGFDEPQVCAN